MRIGTFDERLGGISVEAISSAISSGAILIPHMEVLPSFVLRNGDSPPEIELKFEMERDEDIPCNQWPNWALQFVHNQLFEYFHVRILLLLALYALILDNRSNPSSTIVSRALLSRTFSYDVCAEGMLDVLLL